MTVTIKQALDVAAGELSQSDSPRLDAELLLAHILSVERSHLYAHPEQTLSCVVCQRFDVLVRRRAQSEPIAYLLGEKSFWDLTLKVSSAVLIPRPETELLVETALELGASASVDSGGREGLPYDGLADVGGDEQRDATAQSIALRQQLVEDDHHHSRREQL